MRFLRAVYAARVIFFVKMQDLRTLMPANVKSRDILGRIISPKIAPKSKMASQSMASFYVGLLLLLNAMFAPVAKGRPILNQSPEILERYFGRPVREVPGKPPLRFNLYSPTDLKSLIPQTAVFAIYFSQQRAYQIVVKFFTPTPYGQAEAFALFNYIFDDNPSMWKEIRHDKISVSDGQPVTNFAYCVGNGIVNEFTAYGSSVDYVSFKLNSICKIPERQGHPK